MEIKYNFRQVNYMSLSIKDSYSFSFKDINYFIATNVSEGGLAVYRQSNSLYKLYDKCLSGWTRAWAPYVFIQDNKLVVLFCDTSNNPWWKTQRIKRMDYDIENKLWGDIKDVIIGDNSKGVIDIDIIHIGEWYYMFYVVMDWNEVSNEVSNATHEGKWEWWDIYYSVSQNPLGPYIEEINLSDTTEYGIEEAPHVNKGDGMLYWSVRASDEDSIIRRGDLKATGNLSCGALKLQIEEDKYFKMSANNSFTCTHPDSFKGRIRATLRESSGRFYIGELV